MNYNLNVEKGAQVKNGLPGAQEVIGCGESRA